MGKIRSDKAVLIAKWIEPIRRFDALPERDALITDPHHNLGRSGRLNFLSALGFRVSNPKRGELKNGQAYDFLRSLGYTVKHKVGKGTVKIVDPNGRNESRPIAVICAVHLAGLHALWRAAQGEHPTPTAVSKGDHFAGEPAPAVL